VLPSDLPDAPQFVCWDTETSGLYPDDGARVSTVSVAWYEGEQIHSHAWPFYQGLYGKPEYHTAHYGYLTKDDVYKSGPRKGQPVQRRIRPLTAEEALEPDPNLGRRDWDSLVEWLMTRQGLAAHNALFDTMVTSAGVGRPNDPWPGPPLLDLLGKVVWCTFLGQHVLDPQHKHGLKESSDRLWGEAPEEQDLLKEHLKERRVPAKRYDLADWPVIGPYAAGDTARTIRLARMQWQRFKSGEGDAERFDFEMDVMAVLARMEHRGVPYNAPESLRWAAKLRSRLVNLGQKLPFEPTDHGARAFFFGSDFVERKSPDGSGLATRTPGLGLTPKKVTEKMKVASVDAETVTELAARDVPYARTFQEYNLLGDAVSRYYEGYANSVAPDGRLRTRFRQFTSTERTSCERTNLQAIPHDHRLLAAGSTILAEAPSPRRLIEAPEGWELWHMDLQQAELRVASQFARCKLMIEMFTSGLDPHGETAKALGLATGPDDPGWFKARSVIGKRANFSLIFGIGHCKFRDDVRKQSGLDLEEPGHVCANPYTSKTRACTPKNCRVKKLVTDWRELYPEFGQAINVHSRAAERDGWTLIRGSIRKWYTDLEKLLHDQHKAFNNKVQGNIGLFTKHWAVKVDRLLMDEGIDPSFGGLLLNIHDALLLMLPVGRYDLAQACADIARQMWDEWFTVPGGVDVGPWLKQ
jgi:hypothetical protein